MAALVDQLYIQATTRDAISAPMLDDLQKRTGAAGGWITRAGLEDEDFRFLSQDRTLPRDEIRVAYAGTIIVPAEFRLFVAALDFVRPRLKRRVTLDLFGSHSYANEDWFDSGWMREHGDLSLPELSAHLRESTWGFSPMALTDQDPRYNRFSLPTKFVSYLAAGLPVITLGHPESSLMQMARRYSVGLATSARDIEALAPQLFETMAVQAPRLKYGAEIARCAGIEFDATQMRAALHRSFEESAEATRSHR
jgi:hypothetical protein